MVFIHEKKIESSGSSFNGDTSSGITLHACVCSGGPWRTLRCLPAMWLMKVGNESLKDEKLYTAAMNNFVATSQYYPQLANAEETGEYSACDEALIKYFSQSEEIISDSMATP